MFSCLLNLHGRARPQKINWKTIEAKTKIYCIRESVNLKNSYIHECVCVCVCLRVRRIHPVGSEAYESPRPLSRGDEMVE